MNYVVGFLFSPDRKNVVLIKKNRPDWQKDQFNGIGGHVEEYETAWEAMGREFNEETGVFFDRWECFHVGKSIDDPSVTVSFFKAFDKVYERVCSMEDEAVEIVSVDSLKSINLIYNLNWLIPLALDDQTFETTGKFTLNKNWNERI
jgi:8-oxo-dGTP pyrophosphatase MutT (NUDIX family)